LARTIVVDFDGTITEEDMLDAVARVFGDEEVYARVERGLDDDAMTLRDVITLEFEPVTATVDEVVAWIAERVHVRRGFRRFVEQARAAGSRVVVVSSGFEELIRPVLARVGVYVEVKANRVDTSAGNWRVVWTYADGCDVCGQSCKRSLVGELANGNEIVYVGDGYSDRCAALASDRVYATKGLARYLDEHGVPYVPFDDFDDVARDLLPK
jgi:2-hydroxy-3-keto-5-methylthiopentenyl-1-phosphate phosphatase